VKHACLVMAVPPPASCLAMCIPGLALRPASPERAGRWPSRVFQQHRPARARLAAHPQRAALACGNSIGRRGQQAAVPPGPLSPAGMAWPAVTATGTLQGGPLVRLHTHVCSVSPTMTVAVGGELDMESGPGLCDELTCMIWANGPQLALDLTGVTFIDCAGLTALLATRKAVQAQGGWLRLVAVSRCVDRLIKIIGLQDALVMPPPPRRPRDHPEASLVRSGQQVASSAR
jgi:anti-anti-sigma factor